MVDLRIGEIKTASCNSKIDQNEFLEQPQQKVGSYKITNSSYDFPPIIFVVFLRFTMATENIKKMPAVKVVFNPYKNVQGKSTEGKLDRKNSTGNTISGVTADSEILSIDIEKAVK